MRSHNFEARPYKIVRLARPRPVPAPVPVGWLLLAAAYLWLLYRIIKGWMVLADGRPIERSEELFWINGQPRVRR